MREFEEYKISKQKRLRETKKDKFVEDNRRSVFAIEQEKIKRVQALKKKDEARKKKKK